MAPSTARAAKVISGTVGSNNTGLLALPGTDRQESKHHSGGPTELGEMVQSTQVHVLHVGILDSLPGTVRLPRHTGNHPKHAGCGLPLKIGGLIAGSLFWGLFGGHTQRGTGLTPGSDSRITPGSVCARQMFFLLHYYPSGSSLQTLGDKESGPER